MLKRISNWSKLVLTKKTSSLVLISLFCIFLTAGFVFADDVNLNVNVKQRQPTDTINDFQLSPIAEATLTAQVLGAQSERQNSSSGFKSVLYQILIYHLICWLI